MSERVAAYQNYGQRRVVTICPNVILSFLCLLALVFPGPSTSLQMLTFLACGGLLLVLRPIEALSDAWSYRWIYAIPFWCIATAFWSQYPELSIRHGIQLLITVSISILIATRLSPLNCLKILFIIFVITGLCSTFFGNVRPDGAWIGLFGSKNAFAGASSILALLAFALAFDRTVGPIWRLAGKFGILLGLFLLIMANSAGSLGSTLVALCFGGFLYLLRIFEAQHRLALTIVVALFGVTLLVVVLGYRTELMAFILDLAEKDPTLTGRTDLWHIAFREIELKPLFGHGYQAFWVHGNPLAEDLWAMFRIESRSGFNFHNTYISNAVEIGLVGVTIQTVAFFMTCILCIAWVIRSPVAESVFFTIFLVRQLILSFGEVVFYSQFNVATVICIAALVFGLRVRSIKPQFSSPMALAQVGPRSHAEASVR